jgi:hypothetical protein
MVPQEYINVLRILYGRLEEHCIRWAVTGSLGFALRGIPLQPADIDIQTDRSGAYEAERLFQD